MTTLNNFFNTNINTLAQAKNVASSPQFSPVKQAISSKISNVTIPPAFYAQLLIRVCDALDFEVGKILVWGWLKHKEITSFHGKENPKKGFHEVDLWEHTIISKQEPLIQPVINNVPLKKLKFDVVVALNIKAGKLFIKDDQIMKATTGECMGSGSVEFSGHTIFEREFAPFKLPGKHDFKPGIPI